MPTPRSIEFNHPDTVTVFDSMVKVVGVEVDDARALGVEGVRRAEEEDG